MSIFKDYPLIAGRNAQRPQPNVIPSELLSIRYFRADPSMRRRVLMLLTLGAYGELNLQELARRMYPSLAPVDWPLANMEWELIAMRKERLVRKRWFASPPKYRLTGKGLTLYADLVDLVDVGESVGVDVVARASAGTVAQV